MSLVVNAPHICDLAHSVAEDANLTESHRFTPRPWNRFEPQDTLWWIVPSTDWPAYQYGKGVLRRSDFQPAQVQCGLHVEKGFDRVVSMVYPILQKRGHILDKGWVWPQFARDLANGKIGRAAQAITDVMGSPVVLEVDIWYPTDPEDFEPHSIVESDDAVNACTRPGEAGHIWFEMAGEQLSKLGESCLTDLAHGLASCRQTGDLVASAQSDPMKWAWIDVYIGVLLSLMPGQPVDVCCESIDLVWGKLIRPWLPWIK